MVADDGMGMSFDMEHERDRLPRNYEEEPRERKNTSFTAELTSVLEWRVGWLVGNKFSDCELLTYFVECFSRSDRSTFLIRNKRLIFGFNLFKNKSWFTLNT